MTTQQPASMSTANRSVNTATRSGSLTGDFVVLLAVVGFASTLTQEIRLRKEVGQQLSTVTCTAQQDKEEVMRTTSHLTDEEIEDLTHGGEIAIAAAQRILNNLNTVKQELAATSRELVNCMDQLDGEASSLE